MTQRGPVANLVVAAMVGLLLVLQAASLPRASAAESVAHPDETVGLAQQVASWSPASRVDGYLATTDTPFLVADTNRTVHAVAAQLVQDAGAIVYRRWTPEGGWTDLRDVVLPRSGTPKVIGIHLDQQGMLYVIFLSGQGPQDHGVYYSRAPARVAESARSWTRPVLIAPGADPIGYGSVTGDGKGQIVVTYSGEAAGSGLYSVISRDAGSTWSKPTVVALTYSVRNKVADVQSIFDSQGQVHVVWTVADSVTGNGIEIYYARRDPNLRMWSQALLLAQKTEFATYTPTIQEYHGELFAIYHNGFPSARWLRRSTDNGQTWTEPSRLFQQFVGSNGAAVLLEDSADTLHLLFANRTGDPAIHGLWHSKWQGSRFSDPVSVASGPQSNGFDPTAPEGVVLQGNILLATWTTDPMAGKSGVWWSFVKLAAPALPVVPLPEPVAQPAPTAQVEPAPKPSARLASVPTPVGPAAPRSGTVDAEPSVAVSPTMLLVASAGPVLLLLAVVFVFNRVRQPH